MFGSDIMILVLKQIKCWEGFGWGGAQGRYINQYKQDSKKKKSLLGKYYNIEGSSFINDTTLEAKTFMCGREPQSKATCLRCAAFPTFSPG